MALGSGLAAWSLLLALLAAAPGHAARVRGAGAGAVHRGERTPRVEIRKPLTDKRTYLHTTFDSGLRVLVVSDPEAEKTSFAVAVEAGSLEDPPAFQGLAHFCEHMLFLGSQKYPDTEAFSSTLALYGGKHNAYTAAEETVYFNEINNDGIEKGLDIFAQFFISPTFKENPKWSTRRSTRWTRSTRRTSRTRSGGSGTCCGRERTPRTRCTSSQPGTWRRSRRSLRGTAGASRAR
ncbi:unnamed protein product [Prorocentrum cordatum]|uniref:Peptidase M16 N-terminal domain-containing protein n=1 Tax=Prorocentrum cordatum TaxID=2364126 RepID=A0ABN9R0H8_9DINO|nr:unnamed protein product [Polarella glacialis]